MPTTISTLGDDTPSLMALEVFPPSRDLFTVVTDSVAQRFTAAAQSVWEYQ